MVELKEQLQLLTYDGVRGHDDRIDAEAMQEEIFVWGVSAPTSREENEVVEEKAKFGKWRSKHFVPTGMPAASYDDGFPSWLTT